MGTPGFFKFTLERTDYTLDLQHLKMVIIDEADILFKSKSKTSEELKVIINTMFKNRLNIKPQYVLFSATFDDKCIENVACIINDPLPSVFKQAANAIKLENVKQFKIKLNNEEKMTFLKKFYPMIGDSLSMIYVNKNENAEKIINLLANSTF